jgi:hypothetical protein
MMADRELRDAPFTTTVVIPREGGESSTPRRLRIQLLSLEYWIGRLRGR